MIDGGSWLREVWECERSVDFCHHVVMPKFFRVVKIVGVVKRSEYSLNEGMHMVRFCNSFVVTWTLKIQPAMKFFNHIIRLANDFFVTFWFLMPLEIEISVKKASTIQSIKLSQCRRTSNIIKEWNSRECDLHFADCFVQPVILYHAKRRRQTHFRSLDQGDIPLLWIDVSLHVVEKGLGKEKRRSSMSPKPHSTVVLS